MNEFSKPYDWNISDVRDEKEITRDIALVIEAYALACSDLMGRLAGDSPCGKSYDPMKIVDKQTAYSYAFDMKDGGRKHDLSIYGNVGEVLETLLEESVRWVTDE